MVYLLTVVSFHCGVHIDYIYILQLKKKNTAMLQSLISVHGRFLDYILDIYIVQLLLVNLARILSLQIQV